MKKYAFVALFFSVGFSAFADVVNSQPTGLPMLDSVLVIGVVAVAILLLIRRLRKQRNS
ncbi:hypothetical protein [Spirosoma daeguense]